MLSLIFLVIPSSLADFCVSVGAGNDAHLSCPTGQIINEITFASYGQPGGCPSPSHNPKCDQQPQSLLVANTMCLNHTSCDIETVSVIYGDPCYGSRKAFAATWTCAAGEPPPVKPTLWGGVGYNILNHNFLEATDPAFAINGTLVRDIWMNRWKSINASFVRMVHPTNFWNFSIPRVLPYLQAFRDVTKTTIYWTTFHPVQPNVSDPTAVAAWATERTDFLTSLITADSQGFADILDFYCFANEMENSYDGDWPLWDVYSQAIYEQLQTVPALSRVRQAGLDSVYGPTLWWAVNNTNVSAFVYHDYSGEDFFDMVMPLKNFASAGAGRLAPPKSGANPGDTTPFIFGEFGGPEGGNGCCQWNVAGQQEGASLWIPQKAIAAVAAGAYAASYWTFMDGYTPPGSYPPSQQDTCWGLIKWAGFNVDCVPAFYSYGLLARYFRGPADAWPVTQEYIHGSTPAACVQQHDTGFWSCTALNLGATPLTVSLPLPLKASGRSFFRFRYTAGDATDGVVKECILPKPGANKILVNASAILQDSVEPMSLVVWSEWI